MINQATALLIETGKAGRMFPLDGRGDSYSLDSFHRWGNQGQADAIAANRDEPDADELLDVAVELGRARLEPDDVQSLRKGSVLVLAEAIDEPVEVTAGSRSVARGELVVVDGKIGVRIVELLEREQERR